MKNRGFTLIELLIVIAVLAAVGVIVTISLTSTLQNTNQKGCDNFVKEIEDAACVYAGLSNQPVTCNRATCPPVKLSLLMSEGLIEDTTDACTGNEIDLEQTVTITWDENGEKNCEYNGVKIYER